MAFFQSIYTQGKSGGSELVSPHLLGNKRDSPKNLF